MATFQSRRGLRRLIAPALAAATILAGTAMFGARADNAQGKIGFTATQSEVAVDGEFKKFAATVAFDPSQPGTGRVDLVIDLASVTTGSTDADDLLKGKDFFDVAHFPQARFTSTAIAAAAAGRFQARGEFALKGRRGELLVPFTARPEGAGLRIEGSVPVSRLAYQVGAGQWADTGTLADPVQIRFSLFVPR